MYDMKFHEKLLKLCGEKGWDQKVLAARAGVSKSTINNWMTGSRQPYNPDILRVAKVLDVSIGYLLDDALDAPLPREADLTEAERVLIRMARRIGLERALEALVDVAMTVKSPHGDPAVEDDPPDCPGPVSEPDAGLVPPPGLRGRGD